jgi:putative transposase
MAASSLPRRSPAPVGPWDTHRRGGYRDPESQAFIESWFGQFKKRLAWRSEWESFDQPRNEISGYVDGYQQRPPSQLADRTEEVT